ncbi:unnamed protein product, partial [marine sediment metagenome]
DEAHNIEKVALQYLGVSLNYYRIRRILNRLYSPNEHRYGLFAMLRKWAEEVVKGWPEFADNVPIIEAAVESVQYVRSVTRELFECLYSAVLSEAEDVKNRSDGKLRYDENIIVFSNCAEIIEAFNGAVSSLIQAIDDIKMLVSGISSGRLNDKEEILIDLEKSQVDIQGIINDFDFLIEALGRNVFWFEFVENGNSYSLKVLSAPLDIAEKLAVGLYDHMETVIMTSATLTVARDFTYLRERLGLNLDSRERV